MPDRQEETSEEPEYNPEKIFRGIGMLPDGYRIILTLYLLEGYDHSEISQILGISESTSKSQYSRAKSKLRNLLLKQ
jgi:RNA polymerase sigma factor (sigma-70 family)